MKSMNCLLLIILATLSPLVLRSQNHLQKQVDSLLNIGNKMDQQGDLNRAINNYQQAYTILEAGNFPKAYLGEVTAKIAYSHYYNKNFKQSVKYLKKSLFLFKSDSLVYQRCCDISADIAIMSYYNLHSPIDTLGKYALIAADCASNVFGMSSPELGRYINLYGTFQLEKKNYQEAQAIFHYAHDLLDMSADSFRYHLIESCSNLYSLYNILGNNDSSIIYAKEALFHGKLFYRKEDIELARLYDQLAFAFNIAGQLDSSILYLDSAYSINPKVRPLKTKAEFYYRKGVEQYEQNNYAESKKHFINAGTFLINNNINDTLEASIWLYIAGIAAKESNIEEAQEYYDKCYNLFVRYYGKYNSRTVEVLKMKNELQKVSVIAQTTKTQDPKLYPNLSDNNYLKILNDIQLGYYEKSIKEIQRNYKIIQYDFSDTLNYYSDPSLSSPTIDKNALFSLLTLKSIAFFHLSQKENSIEKLKYSFLLLKKCDTLINQIRNNISFSKNTGLEDLFSTWYETTMFVAGALYNQTQNIYYFEQAFIGMEQQKAFSLLNASIKAGIENTIPSQILETEKQLKEKIAGLKQKIIRHKLLNPGNNQSANSLQDSLFKANANLDQLISNAKFQYPKYWELSHEPSIVKINDVTNALDPQTAIISYTFTKSGDINIIIIAQENNTFFLGKKVPKLNEHINTINKYISGEYTNQKNYLNAAYQLHEALIAGVGENIKRLIIIPDGILHNLPFEALITTSTGNGTVANMAIPYLIKKYAVSYAYSVTLAYEQLIKGNIKNQKKFLLGYSSPQFNDLKIVEKLCIEHKLDYKIQNKPSSATQNNFLSENLKQYSIIHISAHGNTSPQPEGLGVMFSGSKPIYFGDIIKLDIEANLVLLLACMSGDGNIVTGEGLIGLNRAFYIAGAKNIILFRTNLNNEANTFFCKILYEQLIKFPSQTYSESLQKARLAMLNSNEFSKPVYWAGYYLMGH